MVGTGSDCQVVLLAPGIALHHCELEVHGGQAVLHVPDPANVVVLNGKQATPETVVKAGDLLLFAKVGCQVMAAPAAVTAPLPRSAPMSDGDDGRTRIRQALPKFILRGVSGPTFGKTFALVGTMTAGRQPDCDIPILTEEISRQHVRLQVAAEGVMVEDLGSANGTFINDKRVHTALLKPGDELRMDTIRFMLMSPGMADPKPAAAPPPAVAQKKSGGVGAVLWIAITVGMVLAGLATAHRFGVF
jgi:pSer/pThr/pTyr-binding forkhead associated (FHA) protein